MPEGLQVFSSSENLIVDLSDRVLRFLGTYIIAPGASGTITNDGFLTGTPFCFCTMHSNSSTALWPGESLFPPAISVSGNVLTYASAVAASTRLQYGVY